MDKNFSSDIIVIVNDISEILQKHATDSQILTKDWANSTNEEKDQYLEFLRHLYIMPNVLTEKGINALNTGFMELAEKMFYEAVECDLPDNDY